MDIFNDLLQYLLLVTEHSLVELLVFSNSWFAERLLTKHRFVTEHVVFDQYNNKGSACERLYSSR